MSSDRFTFRLERLLSLRQKAEEVAGIALAEARNAETAAHEAKSALEMHRVRTQESLTLRAGDTSTVATLRQVALLMEDADRRIAQADERLMACRTTMLARRDALNAAVQERRVLGRLKERALDSWQQAAARSEQVTMDEFAQTRRNGTDIA
ncbi:flagellar export protein FliJ [bacterium]|nr:flagellar export protein FliJ [bacterium]